MSNEFIYRIAKDSNNKIISDDVTPNTPQQYDDLKLYLIFKRCLDKLPSSLEFTSQPRTNFQLIHR